MHLRSFQVETLPSDLDLLAGLTRAIGIRPDREKICALALETVAVRMPFDLAFVLILDPTTSRFRLTHGVNLPSDLGARLEALCLPDGPNRGAETLADRVKPLAHEVHAHLVASCGPSVVLPLISEDHVIGLLGLSGGALPATSSESPASITGSFLNAISTLVATSLERAELLERLSFSEQKHRATIEWSPDGFLETDVEHNVTMVNDAALRILECSAAELRNGYFEELSRQTAGGREQRLALLEEHGYYADERMVIRTRGGHVKTINVAAWGIVGPDGKRSHRQMSFRDVSARVKMEQDIARRTEELHVLNSLATRLSYPVGVEKTIQEVCDEIVSLSKMENVAVFLAEPRHDRPSLIAVRNADVPLVRALERHPWPQGMLSPNFKLGSPAGILETVFANRRTIVYEDAAEQSLGPSVDLSRMQAYGFRAGIVAPLRHGEKTFGLLMVGSSRPRSFTAEDRDLIENIALRLALSLRNKQLYDRSFRHIRELETLFRTGESLVSGGDLGQMLAAAVGSIEQLLQADRVTIFVDRDGEVQVGATSNTLSPEEMLEASAAVRSLLAQGEGAVAMEAGMSGRVGDPVSLPSRGATRAFIGVPLIASGSKIGALIVGQRTPREWSKTEVRLVRTFARQIAGALHGNLLLRNAKDRVRELESLANFSALSSSLLPEDSLIDLALESIRETLEVPIVVLHLLKGGRFLPGRVRGVGEAVSAPVEMTPRVASVFESREPLFMNLSEAEQVSPMGATRMRAINAQALVLAPLAVGTERLALLTVARSDDHVWTKAEVRTVKTMANQLATAISNARLYQQERDRAERLRLLAEFSQACARMLELKGLLQAVPELVARMLSAPQVSVRLRQDRVLTPGAYFGYSRPELSEHNVSIDGPIEGVVFGHQPLAISDVFALDAVPHQVAERISHEYARSVLFLPLNARGESLGLLSVFDSQVRNWTAADIQFGQTIANTIAISVSNARLLETLKQERGDIEMTLNSVFSGVFTTDEQGVIQTWNRAAALMTGWSAKDMLGKNWVEIAQVSGQYQDELVLEAMAREDVLFGIAPRTLLTARGQTMPLAEAAAPLRDAEGRIRGAVGAFWDRSKERQEEQARLDFLHEASHELRNSLTVVLAMAGLLRQTDVKGATREKAIEVIGGQVDRIKGFSDRFLRFETDAFDHPLEQKVVDVQCALAVILEGLRAKYPDHPVEVVGRANPVYADPRRLDTVLLNLLDNSCKYSPSGSPIWIELKNIDPDLVRVAVRNEGAPIAHEEAKDIFKRGYRGSRVAEDRPGHGIGLWLAQTMLREMGGQICLDEGQVDGVTLYFTLQRAGVEHDERQVPNPDRGRRRPGSRRARRDS